MVEPAGNNINIKVKGTNVQLNKNNVKGLVITDKTPIFMKKYDVDNDGILNQKEAAEMLKDLQKAAKDGTISGKELEKSKLGKKNEAGMIAAALVRKPGQKTVERDGEKTTTVIHNDDGTVTKITEIGDKKIVTNYDKNGNISKQKVSTPSGSATAEYKYDEDGNLLNKQVVKKDVRNRILGRSNYDYKYDEAGHIIGIKSVDYGRLGIPLSSTETNFVNNADGKPVNITKVTRNTKGEITSSSEQINKYEDGILSASTTKNTNKEGTTVTSKTYAEDGRTVLSVTQDVKNKDGSTSHIEQEHNANGKLLSKHTIIKDAKGNVHTDLTLKVEYQEDGKNIKSAKSEGTREHKPYSESVQYDSEGKITTIEKSYYRRGGKFVEHYEGPNLENRKDFLPSSQITYEKDGKTIKEVTTNKFDEYGVLIGSEIRDKDGNLIATHDFSKIDGNFDTAYQKGRGDCYLLAALNAMKESESGRKILEDTITIGKDPNSGETTYTVHFPGAAKVREDLIKQGVPEEDIDIKDSYTYTESELNEKAKLAGKRYSTGDKDVLLLEVAYEDLRADGRADIDDLSKVNPKLTNKQIEQMLHISGATEEDTLSGGLAYDPIYLMTGMTSEVYVNNDKIDNAPVCTVDSDMNMTISGEGYNISPAENAKIDSMFNKMEQDGRDGKLDNYAMTVGFTVSTQTVNGKVIPGGGHALTITRVEGDNVYMCNPWDPTKEIVMTRDEIKRAANKITLTPLADSEEPASAAANNNNEDTPAVGNNENPPTVEDGGQNSGKITDTPQPGASFKVPKGKGYKTLLAEALRAQGITPTPENIQKASEQFKAANNGAVHVYNGSNAKYRGNEFLMANAVVVIPKFEI